MDELMEAIGRIFDGEHIVIDICEYDEKTIAENERDGLLRIIFDNAKLDYAGTGLTFDGWYIWEYLKDTYPNKYANKVKALKDEAERSNGDTV